MRAVLIIAADTGLRQNELFTLSWKENDIDFENRQIRLFKDAPEALKLFDEIEGERDSHLVGSK